MEPSKQKGRAFWGPPQWHSIHSIAATYTPQKARYFRSFMEALSHLLSCDECCVHLQQNLISFPMDPYLGNNHDVFFWTYMLHDAVNMQHNKHKPNETPKYSPPFDEVKKWYFNALSSECEGCRKL